MSVKKLLKVTENNLLVYVDGWSVQKACNMNISRATSKILSTKVYVLIHYYSLWH